MVINIGHYLGTKFFAYISKRAICFKFSEIYHHLPLNIHKLISIAMLSMSCMVQKRYMSVVDVMKDRMLWYHVKIHKILIS